jgi:ABC-type antimicrobial peptide transport system permease subunit
VIREALAPVLAGIAAGGLAAWWTAGLTASLLYGIGPHDPRAFVAGAISLTVAAVLAAFVPLRRATGVDPIVALRAE